MTQEGDKKVLNGYGVLFALCVAKESGKNPSEIIDLLNMTQEDKDLLLKDLCARLPYGVMIKSVGENKIIGLWDLKDIDNLPLPYLRPLSSMTEEECMELSKIRPFDDDVEAWKYVKTPVPLKIANIKHFDFFHSHHLDWRGLIEKGLAIEVTEENNPYKE